MYEVTSANGDNLGPIGQFDLKFRLGNKQFMDRLKILQDLYRNILLGLNWQCNYRIGCRWNVNGYQYITHNNNFLCTNISSSNTEPIFWNSGVFILPLRSILIILVQAPTEWNTWLLFQLDATDDLPSGIIPFAVDHKIDYKYPKLLQIPLPNTMQNTVHIPRKTVIGKFQPVDVADLKISNMS